MSDARRIWVLFFWCFFLILGITENLRSALLPLIKEDLQLSDQNLSGLLMIGALASVFFQMFGGKLIDRMGQQALYHFALFACVASLACSSMVHQLGSALVFFFCLHMGFTLYSLLTNSLIPSMGEHAGRLLTLSHGCYGLGAALSAQVAELLLTSTGKWQNAYQALLIPYAILWAMLIYLSQPQRQLTSLQSTNKPKFKTLINKPELWLFAGLFGCAISAEVASSSWLVRYLSEVSKLSRTEAGYFLTAFYALFTLTRFGASSLPIRLGVHRTMTWGLGGAGICLSIALCVPYTAGYYLALSGLFFALVFPCMVLTLSQRFSEHRAHILGLVISGALGVFMLINALIGIFCEQISVRYSYLIMIFCVSLALFFKRVLTRFSSTYSQ